MATTKTIDVLGLGAVAVDDLLYVDAYPPPDAKAPLVRKQLARVLAERIEQGQYSFPEALKTAKAILYDSPQQLLGMRPRAAVGLPGGCTAQRGIRKDRN